MIKKHLTFAFIVFSLIFTLSIFGGNEGRGQSRLAGDGGNEGRGKTANGQEGRGRFSDGTGTHGRFSLLAGEGTRGGRAKDGGGNGAGI